MAGIFISYRRKESKPHARLIFQDLRKRFRGRVFMDVDGLKPGEQFRDKIGRQLDGCTVLLALMGPQWAQVRDDKSGAVRLFDARDWVRLEITTALQRGITVIPVLLDGAQMPQESEVPPELHPLLDRHAFRLDLDQDFDAGMEKLAAAVGSDMTQPLEIPRWVKVAVPVVLVGAAGGYWAVPAPIPIAAVSVLAPKPDPYPPGKRFRDCEADTCPWLVVIPAGKFQMGSPANEEGRSDDEGPQHEVTIGQPLAVMEAEVTRGQFAAFVTATGYKVESACLGPGTDEKSPDWRNPGFAQSAAHPVVCVSWNDAQAYAKWLAGKTGQNYRLLSEAEWEYSARAKTQTIYSFGDKAEDLCVHANVADRIMKTIYGSATIAECVDGFVNTAPIKTYKPNAFGLYDLHGNAWEWVRDCWRENDTGAPVIGFARDENCENVRRVFRGGGWENGPTDTRSASRNDFPPRARVNFIGFRLARTLAP